ncbi:MAG: hypothetical protein ER33_07850 [Cyanobium sp. CACIAM 14]|nr:MAG: hypothetical protein ER33_07850 [Cyanobium sp. CACIAM 14]
MRTPTSSDDVLIDVPGATPTVNVRSSQTVHSLLSRDGLTVSGATLTLTGNSEIDGALSVTNGGLAIAGTLTTAGSSSLNNVTLTGSGNLQNTGTLSVSGSDYTAVAINNAGTLDLTGGTLQLDYYNPASLNNTGLVDLQGDASITSQSSGDTFTNSGIFRKSGGTGTSSVTSVFNNSGGTVDAESGTLAIGGGTHTGGVFTAGTGAVLSFSGRTVFSGTFSGGGAGQIRFVASNDVYNWWTAGAGGATFNFSSPAVQLSGKFNANGATISNTGYLDLSPSTGAATLLGNWTNSGTIAQVGNAALDVYATVDNTAAGVWDFQGDYTLYPGGASTASAAPSFINHGTLRKSAGSGVSTVSGGAFSNAGGTLDVRTGTLAIASPGGTSSGGSFSIASGATLDLTGGQTVNYSGTYTGSGSGTVQVAGGTLAVGAGGATFNLPGTQFLWTGGGIAGGTGGLRNQGTMTATGSGTKTLGGLLRNDGTLNLQGGALQLDDLGVATIANTGLMDLQADVVFTHRYADAAGIVNTGTVRKSGGTNGSTGNATFANNGGTVDVRTGSFTINGGSWSGGQLTATAGASLTLAGSFTVSGTLTGAGTGQIQYTGASSDSLMATGSGAALDFETTPLQWLGGQINGGSVGWTNRGTIQRLTVGSTKNAGYVLGRFDNGGTLVESGATIIEIGVGAVLTNLAGGLIDFQGDGTMLEAPIGSGSGHVVINHGTVRKSAGTISNIIVGGFDTAGGVIDVEAGTLAFDRGDNHGGVFQVAAGATLDLADSTDTSGSVRVAYSGTFTGSGPGRVLLAGNVLAAGATGATFSLPTGLFQWTGGVIDGGTAGFTNAGSLTLSGSGTKYIGGLVDNTGTITHQAGNLQLDYYVGSASFAGILLNDGLYDLQADAIFGRQVLDAAAIHNTGTLRKSGGTGTATITNALPIDNTGTVEVRSGTLALDGADTTGLKPALAQVTGTTLTGGHWIVGAGATLRLPTITVNQADITLDGTGSKLTAINGLATNAGSLTLSGGRSFSTTGNLANTGRIALGPASTLTVNGTYTQGSTGTLSSQLSGSPASGQFGQLVVSGNAALDGTFAATLASGYGPTSGDRFVVARFGSHSGAFATVSLPAAAAGALFSSNLAPGSFALTAQATAADLAVGAITLPTSTLAPGKTTNLDVRVDNLGGLPATGTWTDSLYLSADTTLDPSDTLLARVTHSGDVAGGASYHDTVSAPLPALADGAYHVIVIADSRGQVSDASRANNQLATSGTVAVHVPLLQIGQPATGQLADSGDVWYHLVVPPGANLDLSAKAAGSGADLFLRQGALPTRSDYDQTTSTNAANPHLQLANAQGGDYYLLVHAHPNGGAAQAYTLAASTASFAVTGIEDTGGFLFVFGSAFTPNTTVSLLAADGTVYAPKATSFLDSTRVEADFDLNNVPVGSYVVRATDGTKSADASSTFDVGNPAIGNYASSTIYSPPIVRVGAPIVTTVTVYGINGLYVPVPFLMIDASNVASKAHVDISGPQLPPLLAPGATTTLSQTFMPKPVGDGVQSDFKLSQVSLLQTIDWDAQKASLRPKSITPEAWDAIWANLRPQLGTIVGDYLRLLEIDSKALFVNGDITRDIGDLFGFEMMKANDQIQSPVSPSALDLSFPAPGLSLDFGRNFLGGSIGGRYSLGRMGRGWVDDFDISATADPATTVVTIREGATTRYFAPDGNGGFTGMPGDSGTLSLVGGGYQLRETTGDLTVFRADGSLDYLSDANGNRITAGYTNGLMTSLTHSDGDTITLAYNAQGRLALVTDPAGRMAVYTYDASGQELLSVTTVAGTTTYTYTADASGPRAHALTSIGAPDGTHVYYAYDPQGRLQTEQLDGGAQALTYSYDVASARVTDALGNATTLRFDDAGRVIRTDGPGGQFSYAKYNDNNQLSKVEALGGGSSSITYDAQGNPNLTTDPTGASTTFVYDPAHAGLAQFTDAKGNGFRNQFDANGNPSQTTMADGSTSTYGYDAQGNLTRSVDRDGLVTTMTYNIRGQLTKLVAADGATTTYTYDAHANLKSATDASGTITMQYDDADRMTRIDYPDGRFLKYAYNAGGQRAQMVDSTGFTTNYTYDAAGRLARLTDSEDNLIVAYTYDPAGRLLRKDQGNGNHTDYGYDTSGELTSISNVAANGSINSSYIYTYDLLGRTSTMTTAEGTTTYGYDGDSRLTQVTLPDGHTITYTYDAAGNRVQVDDGGNVTAYTTNNLNEYTAVGGATDTYDTAGNLATTTGINAARYTYDALGRLVGVTNANDTWTFEYDALGDRTAIVHNGQRAEYLVDPAGLGDVVGSFDGSGALSAHYTYGLGLASQVDAGGNAAYYDFDAAGSTVGMSGAEGTYLNQYSYMPFGELRSATQTVANPFQFGGAMGVQADSTGLSFMRARYYDATTGRFTQADPAGIAGGANLYAFSGNDPMNIADPSGLGGGAIGKGGELGLGRAVSGAGGPSVVYVRVPDTVAESIANRAAEVAAMEASKAARSAEAAQKWAAEQAAAAEAAKAAAGRSSILSKVALVVAIPLELWNRISKTYTAGYQLTHDGNLPPAPHIKALDWESPSAGFPSLEEAILMGGFAAYHSLTTQRDLSVDPNFISGPGGYGNAQYVRGDSLYPYEIGFENQPTAAGPAAQVVITDQLDSNLDLSTFQLGSFGFGSVNVDVPAGRQYYSTRLDERSTLGVFVDATASLDASSRTLTWTLTAIDPTTLDLPADPTVGFLPPDDASGRGSGYVSYFVQPKAGLADGTPIDAQASIVFDANAPVATNVFVNTVDASPPTSAVNALPSTTNSSSFTLSWGGSDGSGAGIASYDVFVSTDGGAFQPQLQGTTQTTTTFTGSYGHSYAFYSLATDNVGRSEAGKTVADTSTTVPLQPPLLAGAGTMVTFTEGGPAVAAAPAITVTDVDSPTLASARVAITSGFLAGDTLAATTAGTTISASYDAGTGVLTLTGSDTLAHYQSVLKSATFLSDSPNPTAYGADSARGLSWQVNDGALDSTIASSAVNVVGVDQAAVLSGTPGNVTFTQGGGAVSVAPALVVSDVDSLQLASAQVAITSGFLAGDTLAATTAGTAISAHYDPLTGVLQLSGSDTLAHYQAVLASVTFSSSSSDPTQSGSDTTRTLRWSANDGELDSAPVTSTVTVVPGVSPPVLQNPGPQALVAGQTLTLHLLTTNPNPSPTLRFNLLAGPAGALLDPVTGVLTWTIPALFPGGLVAFSVSASDGDLTSDPLTFSVAVFRTSSTASARRRAAVAV